MRFLFVCDGRESSSSRTYNLPGSAGILACLPWSVGHCRNAAGKDACAPRMRSQDALPGNLPYPRAAILKLQRAPLPWPSDGQRYSRRLNVDEERLAVGTEGRARELFTLIARQDVLREIEDL